MRGDDQQQNHIFSYLSPEARVRKDHPLRAIRAMVDEVLTQLSRRFDEMYARVGRPSIAPEKLLRAQLLQMLYSIRSERLLMEEMDYNLLFRWFVGLMRTMKSGMRPLLPRIGTGCWTPTWPRSSWHGWWGKPGLKV
jgi:transposase